ncbi:MAG: ribonuclease HII [Firmicutes bacterium]|nr:ribonuclease HII [Bacillota bacterium]
MKIKEDLYQYESELWNKGINYVAGVDEVGRGPLIGPVVTACVILPKDFVLEGLNDSKQLSEKKREEYYQYIIKNALSVSIGMKDENIIDEVNIYEATKLAMYEAIDNSDIRPEHVLIDAMKLENLEIPNTSIIKGDSKSISIAAASVVAKVTRDHMMIELDKKHPEYGFASHKGYGTKKHLEALEKHGILKEHRKTFAPVKKYIMK